MSTSVPTSSSSPETHAVDPLAPHELAQAAATAAPPPPAGDMWVTLENVDWDLYEAIDRTRGDTARPRLIYSEGRLTVVSPSLRHDHSDECLGLLVMTVCEELELPCTAAGSTTFRRKDSKLGV